MFGYISGLLTLGSPREGSLKDTEYWYLASTPSHFDLIGKVFDLDIGNFKTTPGDSDVRWNLRTTGLDINGKKISLVKGHFDSYVGRKQCPIARL